MTHLRGGPTQVGSGGALSDRNRCAGVGEAVNLANRENLIR
jgi:hypothetical protein